MARKKAKTKKEPSEFEKKYPSEYDGLKKDDEVIYTRLSDGKQSLGLIRYFHIGPEVYATVIDIALGNFQTAVVNDIIRNPTKKMMRAFWSKISSRKASRL
jgi:hypothetical protein